jgi:carboxyl-terminal processing protease
LLKPTPRRAAVPALLLTLALCPAAPLRAAALLPPDGRRPADEAARAEQDGRWLEACRLYDEVLRRDRTRDDCREAYRRCLRRFHLACRHRDPSYRQALARLDPAQALDLYEQVLAKVAATYAEPQRADVGLLFRQGVQELGFALEEDAFVEAYLPGAPREAVRAFRRRLESWQDRPVRSRAEARKEVMDVALTAQREGLAAKAAALVPAFALEFASGGCNALDEYTLFLTPGRYAAAQAAQDGRAAGVGLELAAVDGRLEVARVYPGGPAQEAGLLPHDRVVRIDGRPADGLAAGAASDRLRGEAGSAVELEVVPGGDGMSPSRSVRLTRRPVVVPTVRWERLPENFAPVPGVSAPAYVLTVTHFGRSTAKEVQEALAVLTTEGMAGLILDLRGNPGGLFEPAVQVAELFVGEPGVLVYTHGQPKKYNQPYVSRGLHPPPPSATVPLVVLVDAETASAAEVVAGALKERGRARVVGQTTYGKGSIQWLVPLKDPPLDKTPGGIRITVAKFESPAHHPYSGRGVEPDVAAEGEQALNAAKAELRNLFERLRPMAPMGSGS